MTSYFVVVVSVLLPISCYICSGMTYLCIFVEGDVVLLGAMTDKWVRKVVCDRNSKISNDQIKVGAKYITAKYNACELGLTRVSTFGVVRYRSQ